MSDQKEVRKLSGLVTDVDDTGKEYQGRKKYRVLIQVNRDGKLSTLPLDITMPSSDPTGKPPFEVGKEVEFEYTRTEWHPADEPEKITYFYNYHWPYTSNNQQRGGKQWVPQGPKIILRAAVMPKDQADRNYSVELSCSPTDDLGERAGQVNAALSALYATAAAAPARSPARPAARHEEPIGEESPF